MVAWVAVSAIVLLLWILLFSPAGLVDLVAGAGVGAAGVLVGLAQFWRSGAIRALWRRMREALPPLSDTERAALEAGETGWENALFTGAPRWKDVLHGRVAELIEAEQAFLDGPVERLCAMLADWRARPAISIYRRRLGR